MSEFYPRFAESIINDALRDSPVVLIHGSRQSGKTTLAKQIGEPLGYHYFSFDDANQLAAAKADPVGFVRDLPDFCILDEIQRAPELFAAIKANVDANRVAGRFILTGSANILLLPTLSDSLAGRMEIVHLRPLSRAEIAGRVAKTVFDELLSAKGSPTFAPARLRRLGSELSEIVCAGGYPPAILRSSVRRRSVWYRDYVTTLIQRDVQDIAAIQNLSVLPRLLETAASQTARLFNVSELASPFALSRPTISDYIGLLGQLFIIEQLQPWHTNRLSRSIKTPKLHFLDTGLVCSLLGLTADTLYQDRGLLGQILETFVLQELRKHADSFDEPLKFFHFRNKDKVEVDIVVEAGRRIYGIEVKSASTVTAADFKGLKKLQQHVPSDFGLGVVFYDGDAVLPFGEGLFAVPVSVLL
ncbi:ATPase AAA [Pseudidiomarina atlantica]|uniref:ATPase AAA n=1 Tax=Pseudidiomarina atlantica TaxID=1517416 RepID=A0A094IUF6_9GAMM|nr:ATP-binding protein [Pseudidiomarina atlantica]KFZ29459.1 ATPase AAA [Pseudidiomarina atlantica]